MTADEKLNRKLETSLGVGAKKAIFDESEKRTKQKDTKYFDPRKYHTWFDELIRDLNKDHGWPDQIAYAYSMEKPILDEHPITKICENSIDLILDDLLKSNTAITS